MIEERVFHKNACSMSPSKMASPMNGKLAIKLRTCVCWQHHGKGRVRVKAQHVGKQGRDAVHAVQGVHHLVPVAEPRWYQHLVYDTLQRPWHRLERL